MFYHALTGNNEPVEDLEPVLLWENSNPTATFAAQKISLDLTDYVGVIVEYNEDNSTHKTFAGRLYCKKTDNYARYVGVGFVADGSATYARNVVNVDNSGVEFGSAYTNNAINSQTTHIPVRIYGVKKYVVENEDVIEEILTAISISSTYSGALVNLDTNHFEYTSNTTGTRISLVGTEIKALTDGIYGTTKSGNLVKSRYNAGDVISTLGSSGVIDVIAYK